MKLNYVPGLPLRLFPGLSREMYDAVDKYTASNCKIAIFTGDAPTEAALWNITNFQTYVTSNSANLVYTGTLSLEFSYDGFKQKRQIQKMPIDSVLFTTGCASVAQTQTALDNGSIKTDHDLFALVYCPDKDNTLNTTGNDLIFLVSDVGSTSSSFCNVSKTSFTSGESVYFRNLTVSLFQSYENTNTVIYAQDGTTPIGTKKSLYINKVWGNKMSEAYRDCIISKGSGSTFNIKAGTNSALIAPNWASYMQDYCIGTAAPLIALRKYDSGAWQNASTDSYVTVTTNYGYLVNEDTLTLIDLINTKAINGEFTDDYGIISENGIYNTNTRFNVSSALNLNVSGLAMDLIPGLLIKQILNQSSNSVIAASLVQLLIEFGFDATLVNNALKCIIPIGFDNLAYVSSFDSTSGILTIQNSTPAKLKTRYKQTKQNPDNKQLYILIPRYLNRMAIENPYGSYQIGANNTTLATGIYGSISSASFVRNAQVLDGETVDVTTQRTRLFDYTGISIGITDNGGTDLEYDVMDTIDYIDSFTTMFKVSNKY
mgnify:FL=1